MSDDTDVCVCGHVRDEHYHDGDGQQMGQACAIDGCDCFAFDEEG